MSRYRHFFDNKEITVKDLWDFTLENMIFIDNQEGIIFSDRVQDYLTNGEKGILLAGATNPFEEQIHYKNIYRILFPGVTFKFETIKNATPRKFLEALTGVKETDPPMQIYLKLRSYQVLHIFKRVHNPYAYLAPWNIIFIPKVLAPFLTVNEKYVIPRFLTSNQKEFYEKHIEELPEFEVAVKRYIYDRYQQEIDDFNEEMKVLKKKVIPYLEEVRQKEGEEVYETIKKTFLREFSPISFLPKEATR